MDIGLPYDDFEIVKMRKVKVLNIEILSISKKELLDNLHEGVLFTPNVDHLVKLQTDQDFYAVYQQAEWVICDSTIVKRCSALLPQSIEEVIPGSSFFTDYYTYHKDDEACRIFLLGAKEGVAQKAKERINAKLGKERVVGAYSPSFGFEKKEEECRQIIDIINNSGATVLLVGVGAPKQEKWIMKYRSQMPNVKLFMALGATIDFEAGNIKRAPLLWQRLGIEWFYRFLCEPKRLFRRYFIDDMKFFYYFCKQIFK